MPELAGIQWMYVVAGWGIWVFIGGVAVYFIAQNIRLRRRLDRLLQSQQEQGEEGIETRIHTPPQS